MKNSDMPAMPVQIKVESTNRSFIGSTEVARKIESIDCHGLTKRETFAMAAMQGLCVCSTPGRHNTPNNLTKEAVEYADALLAALTQGE